MVIEFRLPKDFSTETRVSGDYQTDIRPDIREWLEAHQITFQAWIYPTNHWGNTDFDLGIGFYNADQAMLFKLTWL